MASTVNQIAALLDLDVRRVQQLAKEGHIPKPARRGEYDAPACIRGYIRYLRAQLDGETGDQVAEKTRLVIAQRKKTEVETDRLLKKLVLVEDVEISVSQLIGAARARLLILPVRLAPLCAGKNVQEIEDRLTDEVTAALNDLSRWKAEEINIDDDEPNTPDDEPGGEDVVAATKSKRRRVVKRKVVPIA
jgi:hypothetical protein